MATIEVHNSTALCTERLAGLVREGTHGWAVGRATVRFRHGRGADFSGACYYSGQRIYINLGRHLAFPYRLRTNLGRAKTVGRRWYRPILTLDVRDGYELATFIFMHELYHLLIKRARRNRRQKESMCDRFAARFLVRRWGTVVHGPDGAVVPQAVWDFQDLEGFVAAARDRRPPRRLPTAPDVAPAFGGQLLLFAG
ncbi:MAG: hypothetical protein HY763_06025 [Planctomycetes bacterium]|nr:hypothetical protein [Planctomycetota bacterium]